MFWVEDELAATKKRPVCLTFAGDQFSDGVVLLIGLAVLLRAFEGLLGAAIPLTIAILLGLIKAVLGIVTLSSGVESL